MMRLYRICTESTGAMRENAIDCVESVFDGFTVIDAVGYWRGLREDSVIIEIVTDRTLARELQITAVAEAIRHANKQEAVMVQCIDLAGHSLVGGE